MHPTSVIRKNPSGDWPGFKNRSRLRYGRKILWSGLERIDFDYVFLLGNMLAFYWRILFICSGRNFLFCVEFLSVNVFIKVFNTPGMACLAIEIQFFMEYKQIMKKIYLCSFWTSFCLVLHWKFGVSSWHCHVFVHNKWLSSLWRITVYWQHPKHYSYS